MDKRRIAKLAAALAVAVPLIAGGATAYARERSETRTDETRIMAQAKVAMSDAIVAAEKATGGKAVGSGIEDEGGVVRFEVTVLKDNARQKVLVDTQTGQVVKTLVTNNDDEDDED